MLGNETWLPDEQGGTGAPEKVSKGELDHYKEVIEQIRQDVTSVQSRRSESNQQRLCVWDGQSTDGRLHKEDLGKEALPFEGASDHRERLSDKIINERVAEYLLAARDLPDVVPTEASDIQAAEQIKTLCRWIRRQWGRRYRRELELFAQYLEGDDPGLAFLGVWWEDKPTRRLRKIPMEDFVLLAVEMLQGDEALLNQLMGVVADPDRANELAAVVGIMAPELSAPQTNQAAKAFYETGFMQLPETVNLHAMPRIEALRFYEDIFLPAGFTSIDDAEVVFLRRLYTPTEARAQAAAEGWNQSFLDKLLGKEDLNKKGVKGRSAFFSAGEELSVTDDITDSLYDTSVIHREKVEIIIAFQRTITDAGVPYIRQSVFSAFVDETAMPARPLNYAHGRMPFVELARENLTRRVAESRGLPILLRDKQTHIKLMGDNTMDYVQVNTNAPLVTDSTNNPRYSVALQPHGQLLGPKHRNARFLARPDFPPVAATYLTDCRRDVDEYAGRPNADVPPDITIALRQKRIDDYATALADAWNMCVSLSLANLPADQLARIVGGKGMVIPDDPAELACLYDFGFHIDVRDWDPEQMERKLTLTNSALRSMDRRQTIQYEPLVRAAMHQIWPGLADASLVDPAVADQREQDEEQAAFGQAVNGIRARVPEAGQANPRLRLQVLNELLGPRQQNPGAFSPLSPAAIQIIEERISAYEFQIQQEENAITGRTGVEQMPLEEVEA